MGPGIASASRRTDSDTEDDDSDQHTGERHVSGTHSAARGAQREADEAELASRSAMQSPVGLGTLSERDLGPLTAGRLVNLVLHDLANLMTALRQNAAEIQLLLAEHPQAEELIADLRSVVEQCTELTQDVLGTTRRTPSKRCPLDELVVAQHRLLTRIVARRATLRFDLNCPVQVTLSLTDVSRILTNLVINATHAVPLNGEITVRTRPIGGGAYAAIEVLDDGEGIDAGTLGQVFDEAFTTRADVGLGLGLSIVRSLAEREGGVVEVESQRGGGALFRVLLPTHGVSGSQL